MLLLLLLLLVVVVLAIVEQEVRMRVMCRTSCGPFRVRGVRVGGGEGGLNGSNVVYGRGRH